MTKHASILVSGAGYSHHDDALLQPVSEKADLINQNVSEVRPQALQLLDPLPIKGAVRSTCRLRQQIVQRQPHLQHFRHPSLSFASSARHHWNAIALSSSL